MMQTFKFLLWRAAAESLQKNNIMDNFDNGGAPSKKKIIGKTGITNTNITPQHHKKKIQVTKSLRNQTKELYRGK